MTIEYHEPPQELSQRTRELHRAYTTLVEEIEAVDWYQQRVDVTADEEMAHVLRHNRDEEMEHAAMTLEWIRRNEPTFAEQLQTYLFTPAPITEIEDEAEQGGDGAANSDAAASDSDLGIGKFHKFTR